MPHLTGFARPARVRGPLLENLKVIILSALGHACDSKMAGLDLGADDFITKLARRGTVLARIRMTQAQPLRGIDANPLTHPPGKSSIERRIERAIKRRWPPLFCRATVDINQSVQRHVMATQWRPRVSKVPARVLATNWVRLRRRKWTSLSPGHIGGDTSSCSPLRIKSEMLAASICAAFDAAAPSFYNEETRASARSPAKDRQGQHEGVPPAVCLHRNLRHNRNRKLESFAQVAHLGADF